MFGWKPQTLNDGWGCLTSTAQSHVMAKLNEGSQPCALLGCDIKENVLCYNLRDVLVS